MAASTQTTNDDLPDWFRKILVPIVGLVLVLVFILRGFPYDAIADRITATLGPAIGAQLHVTAFEPSFGFAGPALLVITYRQSLQVLVQAGS